MNADPIRRTGFQGRHDLPARLESPQILGAVIGSTIGGAVISAIASDRASGRVADATQASVAETRRQFDLLFPFLAPRLGAGVTATNAILRLLGLPQQGTAPSTSRTPTRGATGSVQGRRSGISLIPEGIGQTRQTRGGVTMTPEGEILDDDFAVSPDFQFVRDEALRGVEQSAAARGGVFSGNTGRALIERSANVASGEFQNRFNRLASLAGLAPVGAATSLSQSTAGQIGGALITGGAAEAQGIRDIGGSINQGIEGLLLFDLLRRGGSSTTTAGTGAGGIF